MKFSVLVAATMLFAGASPAHGGSETSITAGEFLQRAEPLMGKNRATLLFSPEARRLRKILLDTIHRNRATFEADRAAGRPVKACLPPRGKARFNAEELIAYLRSLPPAQRSISFYAAFTGMMARKFPCKR